MYRIYDINDMISVLKPLCQQNEEIQQKQLAVSKLLGSHL